MVVAVDTDSLLRAIQRALGGGTQSPGAQALTAAKCLALHGGVQCGGRTGDGGGGRSRWISGRRVRGVAISHRSLRAERLAVVVLNFGIRSIVEPGPTVASCRAACGFDLAGGSRAKAIARHAAGKLPAGPPVAIAYRGFAPTAGPRCAYRASGAATGGDRRE